MFSLVFLKAVYNQENIGISKEKAMEEQAPVCLEFDIIIMTLGLQNVICKMASNMKRPIYEWNTFFGWILL